jgi:hypothetical protein
VILVDLNGWDMYGPCLSHPCFTELYWPFFLCAVMMLTCLVCL